LFQFLESYVPSARKDLSKEELAAAVTSSFKLTKRRRVYVGEGFAIRFSTASGKSFSNTVLALSALKDYDNLPFIVCVVRPTSIELLLANTTFLRKISHSSHRLRENNVRGSFLGHDILRSYDDIENTPEMFSKLFAIHQEFTWEENLRRLVEATNNIAPTGVRFSPTEAEQTNILASAGIAHSLSQHSEYLGLRITLDEIVLKNQTAIIEAGRIDNVNQRGNTIEQIITDAGNFHGLQDISFTLTIGTTVLVDVKTKIITLTSCPKGYNIDKILASLAAGDTVFSFFFVGLDLAAETIVTCLVSILDETILGATKIQFHWAGRNSRGVTQLTGGLTPIFDKGFRETINVPEAQAFLQKLLDCGVEETTGE